jgi:GTP cyclohydrolase-4
MNNNIFDPVNYKITWKETDNYDSFLDELTDVPASIPLRNINISEAGITNQEIILRIKGLDWEEAAMYTEVSLHVSLEWYRGIHMSRCEEVLFEAKNMLFDDLNQAWLFIAKELRNKQKSKTSFVSLKAHYFHPHITKRSGKTSFDKMFFTSKIICTEKAQNITSWIEVFNITACPCTKTYTKFSVVPELTKMWLDVNAINKILNLTLSWSHTQRWITIVRVENNKAEISYQSLYKILDDSVHLIYDLLKRPDEYELVVRALKKPQFTEDVIRAVAYNLIVWLDDQLDEDSNIYVESLLNDSIHIHDVHAKLVCKVRDIKKNW